MDLTHSPGSRKVEIEHLESLATATGIPFDPAEANHALECEWMDTNNKSSSSLAVTAASACRLGMDARIERTTVKESLNLVRDAAPILLSSPRNPDGIVVLGFGSRKIKIADHSTGSLERWVSSSELITDLGLKSTMDTVEVLLIQPKLPYQDLHDDEHPHGSTPMRRLFALLRTEQRDVSVVVVYAIGIGLLSLATPLAVESLVNSIAFGGLFQPLLVVSLLLFASLGFAAVLRIMQTILVEFLQRRLFVRLIADLSYRLPRVRVSTYDRRYGPELVNRFFDIVTVQKVCSVFLLEGIALFLSTLIGASLLAVYHPYLLIYVIVLIASMIGIVFVLGRGAVQTAIDESLSKFAVADRLEELARSPVAFKLGTGPEWAVERGDHVAREYLSARETHFRIVIRQVIFALALQAIASTVLLGLGGYLVIAGQLTLGQLVAAELIVTVVIGSFTKIGKLLESFYDLLASMDKLGHLIDLPLEQEGTESSAPSHQPATLQLRDVCYSYHQSGRMLFENINLDFQAGDKVAIVGPSGSGKSTLLDLLQGLRFPESGSVTIDDVDTRVARTASLRPTIAFVRDIDIVCGTVLENLRMGRHSLSAAKVSEALRNVGLLEEVARLPLGLNTPLLPSGAPLSRGQAYRLVLARAIAASPRLLLVDGVLDGMEIGLRIKIAGVLLNRQAPWTAVVVSQCDDVVDAAQRVVPLEHSERRAFVNGEKSRLGESIHE